MPIIQWSEEYSIGIPELDAQHQEWMRIYNKAHDRMMDSDNRDLKSTGLDAIREMADYGLDHFAREEELMSEMGFPEAESHKKLHQAFAREIEGMMQGMAQGSHVLNSEIIKRIENWLNHHILNEDQKIKTYGLNRSSETLK